MRRQQFDHQREERWLRTAQVVAAIAVGNMTEIVQLIAEVRHHIADFVPVIALGKSEHGEIAIPIIDLAETPARHDIGLG
ncbi:hypothetical protein D3C76_1019280 [compost metagenome]